jgi:hypothetical protein
MLQAGISRQSDALVRPSQVTLGFTTKYPIVFKKSGLPGDRGNVFTAILFVLPEMFEHAISDPRKFLVEHIVFFSTHLCRNRKRPVSILLLQRKYR